MSDVNDLIGQAIDKSPMDFAATFNDIIQQKQADALEARKVELAQSMYEPAEVASDDDFDYSEDDFEDMDDLEDLDLEDLDLEDIDLDLEDINDDEDA